MWRIGGGGDVDMTDGEERRSNSGHFDDDAAGDESYWKVHFRDLLTLLEGITGVYEVVELERVESE